MNGPSGDPALYVRIAHRGTAFLFDCGDLHTLTAREAIKIEAVLISHAHIDHMIGFGALLRFFLYREKPLSIYGGKGITERIAGHLAGYTWNLIRDYPIHLIVHELDEGFIQRTDFRGRKRFKPEQGRNMPCPGNILLKRPYGIVRALPLSHGDITSLAFSLEEPLHVGIHKDALEKEGYQPGPWLTHIKDLIRVDADPEKPLRVPRIDGTEVELPLERLFKKIAHKERGMKISYVTDVSPLRKNIDDIISFVRNSHFLAIEAVFSHQDLDRAKSRNHLTAHLAGTIAREADCARFITFHHSPRYQDRPGFLDAEANKAFAHNPC